MSTPKDCTIKMRKALENMKYLFIFVSVCYAFIKCKNLKVSLFSISLKNKPVMHIEKSFCTSVMFIEELQKCYSLKKNKKKTTTFS